ncbi:MAG: D-alanine--D-alanine ligase [Polyangiaceae bacterium]|nr:D-alanine--D-alanine ligase [Polyangiaceae bacterium]MCE7894200.1 D-alanine--D-alanine ligase [Sorangiineae bacterium PRO1]MCL4748525.1 D-alanine--D-alanine ligase [Myxococcales bacterium]
MKAPRIGVVMGGTSAEREVSLSTGRAVAKALGSAGRNVVEIELGPGIDTVGALRAARIDVAFLALHGRLGEDGCIQGLLEILEIPYTGSSVLASALAMDKLKSKELFRLHNVPTPPYYVFDAEGLADVEEVHGSFGFPVVVKPRREGSSFGIAKADSPAALARAIADARRYDQSVLVERFIAGKEISVGILDGRVLGAIEIAPKSGMYDHHAKYTPGMTEYFMPARLPATRYRGVLNLAERAAQALDSAGAVRVDLLVTEGQNEYVLEVNTLPGMTPTSLLPKIAAEAGYSFADLCEAIVDRAGLGVAQPAAPAEHPALGAESEPDTLAVAV